MDLTRIHRKERRHRRPHAVRDRGRALGEVLRGELCEACVVHGEEGVHDVVLAPWTSGGDGGGGEEPSYGEETKLQLVEGARALLIRKGPLVHPRPHAKAGAGRGEAFASLGLPQTFHAVQGRFVQPEVQAVVEVRALLHQ